MRNSLFTALLLAVVAAGCHKDKSPATVPPAPEFAEQDKVQHPVPPTPASDGDRAIPPQDQVLFGFNSDNLDDRARALLDEVTAWVKANPEHVLVLEGHADKIGDADYNLDLSARRAQAVRAYLLDHGVPQAQLVAAAAGETEANLQPAAANRRVLIFATANELTH